MITYQYECEDCKFNFEIQQSIKDKPKKKCPACKKNKLFRVIFPSNFIDMSPKTVGGYADKKYDKSGSYEKQERQYYEQEKRREKKKKGLEQIQAKLPKGMSLERPKK